MVISPLSAPMEQLLAALDPTATVDDLYGERGSEVYDAMTRGDGSEIREVLGVGRRTRGRILELACGSGRLTLPLAGLRRETVALDSSPRMLEMLAVHARRTPTAKIHPVLGDMSSFRFEGTFGLIVLATTSISLLSAPRRRAMLRAVSAHLAPDGVFLVSVDTGGALTDGETTRLIPVRGAEADVVVLHERVDVTAGRRSVSVLRTRRQGDRHTTEAFTARAHLLDEATLRGELDAAGLRVRDATRTRPTDGAHSVSMLECTR